MNIMLMEDLKKNASSGDNRLNSLALGAGEKAEDTWSTPEGSPSVLPKLFSDGWELHVPLGDDAPAPHPSGKVLQKENMYLAFSRFICHPLIPSRELYADG